jgi:hypothetical protein
LAFLFHVTPAVMVCPAPRRRQKKSYALSPRLDAPRPLALMRTSTFTALIFGSGGSQ